MKRTTINLIEAKHTPASSNEWDQSWKCKKNISDLYTLRLYHKGNIGKVVLDGLEIDTDYWLDFPLLV